MQFLGYAAEENLGGNKGCCRDRGAKTCTYPGEEKKIVNISRAFLRYKRCSSGDKRSCRYSKSAKTVSS